MFKNHMAAVAASLLMSAAFVTPASAAVVTYELTGYSTGLDVDGSNFNSLFKVTGTGDTKSLNGTTIKLSSLTIFVNGKTYNVSNPSYFYSSSMVGTAGFGSSPYFDFLGVSGIRSYTPDTALASTSVRYSYSSYVETDRGTLKFENASDLYFAASTVDAVGAVPEPATWGMMILGFGLIGGAMRRHKTATRIAYA